MPAKARPSPRPAPVERTPIRLSTRPSMTVLVADVPNVGRVRLTLTPRALAAARTAIDRHDLVAALRAALRSADR